MPDEVTITASELEKLAESIHCVKHADELQAVLFDEIEETLRAAACRLKALDDLVHAARLAALEDAAKHLESRANNFASRCENRGFQDPETGEIPCVEEQRGCICECALQMDLGLANAAAIRALKELRNEIPRP